jgi:hypothetical protein
VRGVLLDAGLRLPDSPKVQAGSAASLAPAGNVDSSEVDPGGEGVTSLVSSAMQYRPGWGGGGAALAPLVVGRCGVEG